MPSNRDEEDLITEINNQDAQKKKDNERRKKLTQHEYFAECKKCERFMESLNDFDKRLYREDYENKSGGKRRSKKTSKKAGKKTSKKTSKKKGKKSRKSKKRTNRKTRRH
jgi:hypothetical protein